MKNYIKLMRPKHYLKNILIMLPLVFSGSIFDVKKDIVTIYGQSTGTYTYESVLGSSVTVPSITAMYVDIK